MLEMGTVDQETADIIQKIIADSKLEDSKLPLIEELQGNLLGLETLKRILPAFVVVSENCKNRLEKLIKEAKEKDG